MSSADRDNTPLRVLVIAPHSFYIDRGTPIDVDILLRALAERGCTVDLACYHDGQGRDYPGLTIHRIEPGEGNLANIGPGFSGKKLKADRLLYRLAKKLVCENDYDVVHAGEEAVFMAMRIQRKLGVPYVYDMDSSIAQQMVEKMPWLKPVAFGFNWFEGRAIRKAVACAPVCHALGDLAKARGARHYEVLHDISQIDPDSLTSDGALRAERGLTGPVFMYVGNFEPYQGVELLLRGFAESMKRGTKADLVIAGGSDEHLAEYRLKASGLGLDGHAHFIGRWPVDELGDLLAQADVLVAPRTRGINTPQKIFPYMHSGKAVLLTDLPTHTQIVDAEVCMLGEPTPAGFADAIDTLATDADLRARLGAAGRAFVEKDHVFAAHRRRVDRLYDYVESRLPGRPSPAAGPARASDPDPTPNPKSDLAETTA
ncbi:MAG: glycosyltransferase involved in cell wall biosynthesis [Phycisphaerales bacterium]|jgi:glycosyltransferase involved in cell wall biosynthesis